MRVDTHDVYDRFVVQFDGPVPAYTVKLQNGTTFTQSPSGRAVTLAGNHGVLIRIEPIGNWTSYSGPTEFDPPFPRLREARLIENFEAVQQWGLGVQGNTCVRVSTLSGPYRLVVDVALK